MDYTAIFDKQKKYQQIYSALPTPTKDSYQQSFDITFAHESTAMEGNTLTLLEVKLLIEDNISVGGKKLREIYEPINHNNAYQYVKRCIIEKLPLDEKLLKDIHEILMANIMSGGIYRSVDVYISGAKHTPPTPNQMYQQIKNFYADLGWKKEQLNPIELAAWTHAEFVKIHPFTDGNGRTSRLIMNYQLMASGYLPISIPLEKRLEYYEALDFYAIAGDLSKFTDLIARLEEQELDRYLAMTQSIV